jgi:hypothetical protein
LDFGFWILDIPEIPEIPGFRFKIQDSRFKTQVPGFEYLESGISGILNIWNLEYLES